MGSRIEHPNDNAVVSAKFEVFINESPYCVKRLYDFGRGSYQELKSGIEGKMFITINFPVDSDMKKKVESILVAFKEIGINIQ